MADQLPISVFIIAKNEVDRIGSAIESVIGWVDEVIVVDSGSEDGTPELAEKLGARVVLNEWPGYGPQKRFAEDLCAHNLLLNIDADESVTPALRDEIVAAFSSGKIREADFWRIHIKDTYPHEKQPSPWAFTYNQIRLYDRTKGRFAESSIHDSVLPGDGAVIGQFKKIIAHRSLRSIAFFVDKLNRYTTMQVADWRAKKRVVSAWRLLVEFPAAFFKAYFIRKHCFYGLWGFVISMNYAYIRFLRIAKAYEAELNDKAK